MRSPLVRARAGRSASAPGGRAIRGRGPMIKRLVATGAVLGVVALTAGSIGSATGQGGGGHHGNNGDKVRVLSTNTEEGFVDVGDPDFSLGDQFVFTSELTKRGKLVGHTGVVCTVTSLEREESQCVG